MDLSGLLKVIPESSVSDFVDNIVDTELAKVATELKSLIKTGLDKAYGTSIATATSSATAAPAAKPLSTSAS